MIHLSKAETFAPRYYLNGYYPLVYNKIDYLKMHKGFNISEYSRPQLTNSPITTQVVIDYDNDLVTLTPVLNKTIIDKPWIISIDRYFENSFHAIFKAKLAEKIKELLRKKDRTEKVGLIPEIVIELPNIALPKAVRRFMGDKAGRLNLDGTQRLTFSGNKTTRDEKGGENDQRGDFDVVLQQDLNLRLRGTIGEKIHVDVNHQSTSQKDAIPVPTEVNVSYEGNEDEIVQSIEGGNISLALSGSRFISYSVSSAGLFGIKSRMKAGNLEITTIMGKDEAQKNTQKYRGVAQADSVNINSRDFIKHKLYFIDSPDLIYELYSEDEIKGYKNNRVVLDGTGKWMLKPSGVNLLPDQQSQLTLYLDDHNASNNTSTIEGKEIGNEETIYNFNILSEGYEFTVDYDTGIITIYPENIDLPGFNAISKLHTIGVTYTRRNGTVVGNDSSTPVRVKLLQRMNQSYLDAEWDLMLRNVYSLGMRNVQNEGFDLNVFTENVDGSMNYNAVDSLNLNNMRLNDYLALDTNMNGIINGEDATINLESGHIIFPFIKPFKALGDSIIYYEYTVNYNEFVNKIGVKGQIGKDQINLNAMNILPGSVVIRLNGRKLTENAEYIVDYDFGNITFLTDEPKAPDADIEITYQYRPMFVIDNKTILGVRADMNFTPNLRLGGTLIYQSETVKDDRPKIYNENRSIILSDIDGEINFEMPFMTRLIDWLPLIKTDVNSTMNISGEVAMSIPRIYGSAKQHDRKEAYIDDMESIMEVFPLGVSRPTWVPASVPTDKFSGQNINLGKAKINWYNPQNIYAHQVFDPQTLTEQEQREKVPVLACKIKPNPLTLPGFEEKYWAGLMKYVGNEMDFSDKKYIEFLVKVDTLNYNYSAKPVIMHINLGVVSEDFYRPGESPVPDKEDGIVNEDGLLDYGEDVGLDRIPSNQPGDDPFDDFDNKKVIINGEEEYPFINGTEGNGILDTEDLNNDGILNKTESYFSYSAVINKGNGFDGSQYLESQYNGWRLYRIPLKEAENYQIISNTVGKVPRFDKISYARIWFEVEDSTRVKLVSLDLVGNKWQESVIRDQNDHIVNNEEETMLIGVIDNQKDPHYKPAPHTVIRKEGKETLEQSLFIDYRNLGIGHYGLATQLFRDRLNFTSYEKMRFWIYLEDLSDLNRQDNPDTLIFRIGPDTLNYYQIKYPVKSINYRPVMIRDNWEEVEIDFAELTKLKNPDVENNKLIINGQFLSLVGTPTLTNTKALSVGLQATEAFTGRLYINDIRVANPYEDIGFAARTSMQTKFADFIDLNVNLEWRSENFQSTATRNQNPSYAETFDINITNKYFLQKFLPAEWGLNIPVTLRRNQTLGIPRFKANSDLLREDLPDEEKEREQNRSLTRKVDASFSQSKTPANKILAYTVKNTTFSGYVEERNILSSTSADTTITINMKHNYKLTIPKEKIDLKLFGNYFFYFFPRQLENQFTYEDKLPRRWYWQTNIDTLGAHWAVQSNTQRSKSLSTNSSVNYDIFSDITSTYRLTTKRDLLLRNSLYNVNIGTEKDRTQDIGLNYSPKYLEKVFSLTSSANVKYMDSYVRTGTIDTLYYKGNVSRDISTTFTLKNRNMLQSLAGWLDKKLGKKQPAETEEIIKEETESKTEKELDEIKRKEIDREEQRKEVEQRLREDLKEKDDFFSFENLGKEEPAFEGKIPKPQEETDWKEFQLPQDPEQKSEKTTTVSPRSHLLSRIVVYIARVDNIRLTYTNNYKTVYDQRKDRPEFLYQLGLPHILKEEGDDKEITLKNLNDKYTASVAFPILNILNTNWNYSKEFKRTYSFNNNITITTTFPNVSVTLTEVEKLFRAQKYLTSSRFTSSYIYSLSQSGELDFKTPDTEQVRYSMTPLISWIGNWKGNLSTNISLNYSETNSIRHFNTYDTENSSVIKSVTGSLTWSFAEPKGMKILFFRRTNLKNEFSTTINFSVEDTYNTTKGQDGKAIPSVDKIRYVINPEATYKFNANINGGLTSSYEIQNDRKAESKLSIFRLGIFAEVIF